MTTPAWFTSKVDQRLAMVEESLKTTGAEPAINVVMTPLAEPPEHASKAEHDRWDRTCDGCGAYVPHTEHFYTGHHEAKTRKGTPVVVIFGVCESCNWDD